MAHAIRKPRIPARDYLLAERTAEIRHEYVDGEGFAMAGASRRHNRIALSLAIALREHAVRGGCDVYLNDIKVRVEAANAYYDPDLVVTRDPGDDDEYVVHAPTLIVEVLSPNTHQIDRREKLLSYRTIPSLREYVIVAQDEPCVEVHRRTDEGWITDVTIEGGVTLESVGVTPPLATLYA